MIDNKAAEDKCDVRIGWVLQGAQTVWSSLEWIKFTETSMSRRLFARSAGFSAGKLAAEQANAEDYRARLGFGLQN